MDISHVVVHLTIESIHLLNNSEDAHKLQLGIYLLAVADVLSDSEICDFKPPTLMQVGRMFNVEPTKLETRLLTLATELESSP